MIFVYFSALHFPFSCQIKGVENCNSESGNKKLLNVKKTIHTSKMKKERTNRIIVSPHPQLQLLLHS